MPRSLVDVVQDSVALRDGELCIPDEAALGIVRALAASPTSGARELLALAAHVRQGAPRVSAFLYGLVAAATDMEALDRVQRGRRAAVTCAPTSTAAPRASAQTVPLALRVRAT